MPLPRQVVVLAGGVGAARFIRGLALAAAESASPPRITVIGNTADDIWLHGLRVCPDLDSVMYTLGGAVDDERGWGRCDETFRALEELRAYGSERAWFQLGDRDLATHIVRTDLLRRGYPLSSVTDQLCRRWELPVRLLPMTDAEVTTHVVTTTAEDPHFQEWWVRDRAEPVPLGFKFVGADRSEPAPGVLEALATADVVLLAPSNPVVSIGPILAIPGIRQALRAGGAPVVGVSPIIGGAPVRGMADRCLEAIGVPVSASGVAGHYGSRAHDGILDGWLVDSADAESSGAVRALDIACAVRPTLMTAPRDAAAIALAAIDLGLNP